MHSFAILAAGSDALSAARSLCRLCGHTMAQRENPPLQRRALSRPVHSTHHRMERGGFAGAPQTCTYTFASHSVLVLSGCVKETTLYITNVIRNLLLIMRKSFHKHNLISVHQEHRWWERGKFLQSGSTRKLNTRSPSNAWTPCFLHLSRVGKCCPLCSWPWAGHCMDWFPQGLTGKTYMRCSEHMALIRPVTSVQHVLTNFALASTWRGKAKLKVTCKKETKLGKFQCWAVLLQSWRRSLVTETLVLGSYWPASEISVETIFLPRLWKNDNSHGSVKIEARIETKQKPQAGVVMQRYTRGAHIKYCLRPIACPVATPWAI